MRGKDLEEIKVVTEFSMKLWTSTEVGTWARSIKAPHPTVHLLKSVNSNFTLAVHSPNFGQAKTHFLSHLKEKREKKYG